jgi:hypothetical protein
MGRYHFGDKVLRPYVAFGLGYLSYRNVGSEGDSFAPGIGVGLQGKLAKHWSMRAQLYFRGIFGAPMKTTPGAVAAHTWTRSTASG